LLRIVVPLRPVPPITQYFTEIVVIAGTRDG
jgi:hypothetical protein